MKPIQKPEYLTKEQIVRGTSEARRLGFDAFTNEFLRSLSDHKYRTYGAWSHKNHEGFADVVRIGFYIDRRSPSSKTLTMIDVTHDMYAEMLSNPIDEEVKNLLSRRIFQMCPPASEEFEFCVEFRDFADDDAVYQIIERILETRLPDWQDRIGPKVAFAEAPLDIQSVDYIVHNRNEKWQIDPCGENTVE